MNAGRLEWVETSVRRICDKRVAAKVKGNVFKRVARPATWSGLKMAALTR